MQRFRSIYGGAGCLAGGIDKGEIRKVDASFKAEQEKRRREEALINATGLRVLQPIAATVPVRLMKRNLLVVAEQLLPLLDEKRLKMIGRKPARFLRAAAQAYKVDTDAIALKVKQEFAAKDQAKSEKKAEPKQAKKTLKKTA